MKKSIFSFYITNYKGIHHSITIALAFAFVLFLNQFGLNLPIFQANFESLLFGVFVLTICLFVTKFTLKKSGLQELIESYKD